MLAFFFGYVCLLSSCFTDFSLTEWPCTLYGEYVTCICLYSDSDIITLKISWLKHQRWWYWKMQCQWSMEIHQKKGLTGLYWTFNFSFFIIFSFKFESPSKGGSPKDFIRRGVKDPHERYEEHPYLPVAKGAQHFILLILIAIPPARWDM